MKKKNKALTFTSRQHELLHDLMYAEINKFPTDSDDVRFIELLDLYGSVSDIWYNEICKKEYKN